MGSGGRWDHAGRDGGRSASLGRGVEVGVGVLGTRGRSLKRLIVLNIVLSALVYSSIAIDYIDEGQKGLVS